MAGRGLHGRPRAGLGTGQVQIDDAERRA